MCTVFAKKLHGLAVLPEHQTAGAAGFDLSTVDPVDLYPGERRLFKIGMAVQIPTRHGLLLLPRSGLASRGLVIPNAPALIDEDYRGPISVILWNLSDDRIQLPVGSRVCQGMLVPYTKANFIWTDILTETDRGAGGFGSTGV